MNLFFIYARQAGVLSFDSRDSRGVVMNYHEGRESPAPSLQMPGRRGGVGSGVMGSDGFESKKLGGPPSGGAGPSRVSQTTLGPNEFAPGSARDPALDAFQGLGDSAANLVEI